MKKILKHIVVFLLIFTVLNFLVTWVFKKAILENTFLYQKERQFEAFDDTLTYLCLGDSRIQNAVDPEILGNCFNFSSPNESYTQTYYKFKSLLEKGVKPDYLLLPIDQSSFTLKYAGRFKYNYYWVRYVDFFEVARVQKDWKIVMNHVQGRYFPYADEYKLVNSFVINYYFRGERTLEMINGFKPRYKNFANDTNMVRTAHEKANLYLKDGEFWEESLVWYFNSLLVLAAENDVTVRILKMPMTPEYLEGIEKVVPGIDFYERLDNLIEKHPHAVCLDYEQLFSDDNSLFWNPDHLNFRGAQLFTKRLKKDLEDGFQ